MNSKKTIASSGPWTFTRRAAIVAVLLTAVWSLQGPRAAGGIPASSQETNTEAQEQAKGMEAMGKACVQCHGLRPVTLQRKPADQWRDTIQGMIGRGAQVMPDEIEPIVSYLVANFGPDSPMQGASAAPAQNSSAEPFPEGGGRSLLMERCVTCHSAEVITGLRQSRDQWAATIRKMRTLGAVVSADEERVATDYLAEHFGSR